MLLTDQITEIASYVRTYFWVTSKSTMIEDVTVVLNKEEGYVYQNLFRVIKFFYM